MKIVLFLGAGFSAPFGMPPMRDVFRFARQSGRLPAPDIEFLERLRLDARGANSFLSADSRNLEDVLSFFTMRARLDPNASDDAERLRFILQKIYTHIPNDVTPEGFFDRYHHINRFLGFNLESGVHDVSIVTTNYDLNVECMLHKKGLRANLGFQYSTMGTDEFYTNKNGVSLSKLHGSVNWYEPPPTQDLPDVDGRMVQIAFAPARRGRVPAVCGNDYVPLRSPILVPPSYLKPEFGSVLQAVWKCAADVLACADVVIFVGYSFPASDTEMAFFIAHALGGNAQLDRIIVADIRAKNIVDELQRGTRYGDHFKQFLVPETGDWRSLQLNLNG